MTRSAKSANNFLVYCLDNFLIGGPEAKGIHRCGTRKVFSIDAIGNRGLVAV
jgi:hypothetical protein